MMARVILPLLLLVALAGCKHVVEYRTVEVKVPVPVPCIPDEDLPETVRPVNEIIPRAEWDAMTTDQRNAKLLANGVRRKAYENEMMVVLVACSEVGK